MLTKKTRYGLKALMVLAQKGDKEPTLIAELAEREGIPRKFLEAILRELRQHGVLSAQRGRGGGYRLRKSPKEISLAAIIRALDGPIAPLPCLSRTAYRRCAECKSERSCGVRLVMRDIHETNLRVLENTTLDDLVKRSLEASEEEVGVTLRYAI
jgi:Rrf2 family protein